MRVEIPYTRLDRFRSGLGPLPGLLPQVVFVCKSFRDSLPVKRPQCSFGLEAPDVRATHFVCQPLVAGVGCIVMDIRAH